MKETMLNQPETTPEASESPPHHGSAADPPAQAEAFSADDPAQQPPDPAPSPDFPENSAALQSLRDEMEGYLREKDAIIREMQQREQQHLEAGHREMFRTVLTDMGAHPQAAALMAALMDVAPFRGEKSAMTDAARRLRETYDALFLREEVSGLPPVTPLRQSDAPLTRSGIHALTEGEIIARWPQVQRALRQE